MKVTLIEVPYDSGHLAVRMGRGPLHLIQGGLAGVLEKDGHDVRVVEIRLADEVPTEVPTEVTVALETQRQVARCATAEIAEGRFPLVLSGNCATCVGSVAAAAGSRTGVVWLDSHGDFNTPETSPSGFLDGMVLAMLTGDCWRAGTASVPGFEPVPERQVILVGARDFDPEEEERLSRSELTRISVGDVRRGGAATALGGALDALAPRIDAAYLHLDLDVLDPRVARVNAFQAADGLTVEEVLEVIEAVAERLPLAAAAMTAYDPEVDEDGAAGEAARRAALTLARLGGASRASTD